MCVLVSKEGEQHMKAVKNIRAGSGEKPIDSRKISIAVNGCKVELNFPMQSDSSTINDVKRMMVGGAIKT